MMHDDPTTPPVDGGGDGAVEEKDGAARDSGGTSSPAHPRGSETRQRQNILSIRLTPEERTRVHDRAEKAGLSAGAFTRHMLLGEAGPRARKRTPADRKELVRLLGAVNRVGNNINQIAHALNAKQGLHPPILDAAMQQWCEAVRDIRAALGRDVGEDN